ncbi:hypothetical protein Gotur_005376 [Gossypium turneri]
MSFKCKIFYALSAFQSPGALQSRTQISSNSISPIPSKPIPITPFFSVPVGTTSSPSTTTHSKQPKHSSTHSVNQKKTIRILGSCNGLLALKNDNERIFLWNPSTRKSQVLPSTEIGRAGLTFYGFGYDPISDDYNVVRMVQSELIMDLGTIPFLMTTNWFEWSKYMEKIIATFIRKLRFTA